MWKEQHHQLVEAMKYNRMMNKAQKTGADIRSLPVAPPVVDSSLVPCSGCGRKFNEVAHAKHEKLCLSKKKDVAKAVKPAPKPAPKVESTPVSKPAFKPESTPVMKPAKAEAAPQKSAVSITAGKAASGAAVGARKPVVPGKMAK